MAKECVVTRKRIGRGSKKAYRGIAKYLGGIGLNTLKRTDRTFKPNVHKKRVYDVESGQWFRLKLTPAGLRTIDKVGLRAALNQGKKKFDSPMGDALKASRAALRTINKVRARKPAAAGAK